MLEAVDSNVGGPETSDDSNVTLIAVIIGIVGVVGAVGLTVAVGLRQKKKKHKKKVALRKKDKMEEVRFLFPFCVLLEISFFHHLCFGNLFRFSLIRVS